MDRDVEAREETFNPWSIVHLIFDHLAAEGLHPQLGGADPGAPAAALLESMGITPAPEGTRQVSEQVRDELSTMRNLVLGER